MRKLITLAALAAVTLVCSDSEASNRRIRMNTVGSGQVVQNAPADGPFARLMELERRKNAALRQMFFGR
jgi:hypothetical protein